MLKSKIVDEFIRHLTETPHDLFVKKVEHWSGNTLQPIPLERYNVEYHDDAAYVLRRVSSADPRLGELRRIFRFRVDEPNKTLHVFLVRLDALSY